MTDSTIIGGTGEGLEAEAKAAEEKAAETKATEEKAAEAKAAEEKAVAEEGKSPEEIKAAEEAKAAEEKKKEEGAPEQYADFTMPNGFEVDKGMLEKFTVRAKDRNLSQEEAQKDIDLYAEGLQAATDAHVKEWSVAMGKWQDDAKADKEIGGDNFNQTQVNVNLALKEFGDEELSDMLERTGTGNHKAYVRFFNKIGALIANDKIDLGNVHSEGSRTQAEIMYPNQGGSA